MSLTPDLQSALQVAARRNLLRGRKNNIDPPDPRTIIARILKKIAIAVIWLHLFYFGWVAALCFLYKFMDPPITGFMVYRSVVDDTRIKPIIPVSHKNIPQATVQMFVRLEDHTFFEHWGISPGAIREAFDRNRIIGRTVFGGSTISQQLARNLFINPERTYFRKYLEAGSTVLLELIVGKSRMMDLYLNVIEFGPGIFGIGQGARYHYKTNFVNLSYEQRARMAAIITDPLHYNVQDFAKNRGMWTRYKALIGGEKPTTEVVLSSEAQPATQQQSPARLQTPAVPQTTDNPTTTQGTSAGQTVATQSGPAIDPSVQSDSGPVVEPDSDQP